MTNTRLSVRGWVQTAALLVLLAVAAAACGSAKSNGSDLTTATAPSTTAATGTTPKPTGGTLKPTGGTLKIGAIPDQDPEKLQRLHGSVATYLAAKLGVKVEYVPVTDYAGAVSLFRTGDLDLVWFGGLTGVQARLLTPGAKLIAQRDIDDAFHSVFIANVATGLQPFTDVAGLAAVKGKRFTFGSESSTSGRTMPQFFLDKAGISANDFNGPAGFSGSHDKTVDLLQSGTFEVGVLNEQVWKARKDKGSVDLTKVVELFRTPAYHDYHWLMNPQAETRFGADIGSKAKAALLALDPADPEQAKVLELFGAKKFIETKPENYKEIEEIGRKLKLIS